VENQIDSILLQYTDIKRENLIPILQDIQQQFGYIPELAIDKISRTMKLPSSNIYGLATFYNQFRFHPAGKFHIRLCNGTACQVLGATNVLKELERLLKIKDGETSKDGMFSLEVQSCIGGCGQAPVIAINDKFFPKLNLEQLEHIIGEYKKLDD
jgi:NADH-quinone oxidoreductase subunit E